MPKFIYKAKKGVDEVIEGFVEAQNKDDVLNKLAAQGIFAISIKEDICNREPGQPIAGSGAAAVSGKVTSNDILLFSQKLLTLLHARVELLASVKVIHDQTENARLKDILGCIYEQIRQGKTFSETLESFPDVFFPLFVNLVKAGEATGKLDFSFEQITQYLSREQALRTKIKVALAYPTMLLAVGLTSVFVLITFVIPKLRPIFESMHKDLPLLTKIILSVSDSFRKGWFWLAVVAIALLLFAHLRKGPSYFKNAVRKIGISIPLIKRLINNKELVNFTRALSLLLNSGVVALNALEIASRILENQKLKAQLDKVCSEVASGQGLAKSMEAYTDMPKFFTKMIAVGEESGRLSEVLNEISQSYDKQVEADILLISALIEPLLILVMGLILGAIILAVLLPTFQITQMVH